jgi:hypothetical protein
VLYDYAVMRVWCCQPLNKFRSATASGALMKLTPQEMPRGEARGRYKDIQVHA